MKQAKQQTEHKDDLELKELSQYFGTENYYDIGGIQTTDGIIYIMKNGYSWVITDAIVILKSFSQEKYPFISMDFKIKNGQADINYTDGNGNIIYTQHYKYTDAKKDFKLFYTDNVLMLSGEY